MVTVTINKISLIVFCWLCLSEKRGNFEKWIFPIIKNDNKIIVGKIIFKSKILNSFGLKINSLALAVGSNFSFSKTMEQIVKNIKDEKFPADPGWKKCEYCSYWEVCEESSYKK